MDAPTTAGLHHVTAIAGDPQRNVDFYVGTLGLRFLKRTVNHDDRYTYHFYFGDEVGTPGTSVTFFPWTDDGRPGRRGVGQTDATAYAIRPDDVDYWVDRLESAGVSVDAVERFGETVLRFEDPDGIGLELVATDEASDARPWDGSPVPAERQLRGFHSVALAVDEFDPTADVLTDVLGFELDAEAGDRRRYRTGDGGVGSTVDLVETDSAGGQTGVGTVHHVAFQAADVEEEERWREVIADRGLRVSDVVDRKYFRSIYFREPGGVLFEIATMGPGFTLDEPVDELGSSLVLPEWLEDEREEIEARLPEVETPAAEASGD